MTYIPPQHHPGGRPPTDPLRIVLASKSRGKLAELVALLAEPRIRLVTLDELGHGDFDVAETGATFEANARLKAEAVAQRTGCVALADDSGLEVDALQGRPGVFSRRYAGAEATDAQNNARLLEELRAVEPPRRSARFRCVLALAVPEGSPRDSQATSARTVLTAEGCCEGNIAPLARGEGGFGYDPVFVPVGWGERTLGEAIREEKNALSHRARAVAELRPRLVAWLDRSNRS